MTGYDGSIIKINVQKAEKFTAYQRGTVPLMWCSVHCLDGGERICFHKCRELAERRIANERRQRIHPMTAEYCFYSFVEVLSASFRFFLMRFFKRVFARVIKYGSVRTYSKFRSVYGNIFILCTRVRTCLVVFFALSAWFWILRSPLRSVLGSPPVLRWAEELTTAAIEDDTPHGYPWWVVSTLQLLYVPSWFHAR